MSRVLSLLSLLVLSLPLAVFADRVLSDPQQGSPSFQWQTGVTAPSASVSGYQFDFETLGSQTPAVGYVDMHYSINSQPLKNYRLINSTSPFLFSLPVDLSSSDIIEFNFTYLSLATSAAVDTLTYSYSPSFSPQEIRQVTVVPVPQPSTAVYSLVQQAANFNWRAGFQRYSNMPRRFTALWSTTAAKSVKWVDLHYIVVSAANVEGSLQNYRMLTNETVAADGSGSSSWDIELNSDDRVKFNFTFFDLSLNPSVAVDTIAFIWTPSSNVINYITNINDDNVDVNPNGSSGTYFSTGANGSGSVVSSTGSNSNSNNNSTSGAGSRSSSSSTGANGNSNNNGKPSTSPNAAVKLSGGLWMGISGIVSVLIAALLI